MKKSFIGVAIVAVTAALLWWMRPKADGLVSQSVPPPAAGAPAAVPGIPTAPSPRMAALQQGPREPLRPNAEEGIAPECLQLWNGLRSLDLSETFSFPPKPLARPLPEGDGCPSLPGPLAAAHQRYVQDCKDWKLRARADMAPDQYANAVSGCFLAASLYRATLTDWATRDQKISDITDPKVLSDKIAARVFTDPGSAAEAAERLLELEPELSPAAKIAAVSRFLDAQAKAAKDPNSPLWNKLDDARATANKLNPGDPDILEMEIAQDMMRASDPRDLRNKLEGLREKNPDVADYYSACVEHKSGNTPAGIKLLQDMIARGTRNPRVPATLQRMQANEPQACQTQVTFPVDAVGTPPAPRS